jgi:hypothetical protein
MKLTINRLRQIIKEEVSHALREAPVRAHERTDDARGDLYLGMQAWLRNPSQLHGWQQITSALDRLIDLEGLREEEIMEELESLYEELGYSDDDIMDLDSSVRDWLHRGD